MAVKGKISISKRNNQKRNKLVKKGLIKSNKKQKKTQKFVGNNKNVPPPKTEEPIEEESDHGEDMLDMVDKDDLTFLKKAVTNQSYNLLKRVRFQKQVKPAKKCKTNNGEDDDDDQLEQDYEENAEEVKEMKHLLPIKTKTGLIQRSAAYEEQPDENTSQEEAKEAEVIEEAEDSDMDIFEDTSGFDPNNMTSTVDMLVRRNELLGVRKLQIGSLSASLLETPEVKVLNLKKLLNFMMERTPEVYLSVRKLATVSLLEIFKDLLPSYQIKHHEIGEVQLKKDTIFLQKYELQLLTYYKHYLRNLEAFAMLLVKKRGDNKKRSQDELALGNLAVQCMCELLIEHPYFNMAHNLAQTVVPFMNHWMPSLRQRVNLCCKDIFKQDKKGDITLDILRILNQYLKNHSHNVNVEMLDVLLALKIKEVNLDEEKEKEIKQKKYMAHKQKLLQMSKKERKRKKKLEQLEQEMMETKAEENKQVKQKNLTEITKILFGIYFKILKNSTNTKILGVCLEGLAKFSHCINLEYYSDLVNVLINLMKEDWLGYREQLHCIQTVLVILSGQGEVLNLDPSRFYSHLYEGLFTIHAGKNHKDFITIVQTLTLALLKRRKKVTHHRLIGFTKRICTLSLQLLHNGALAALGTVKTILQLNRFVDVLLDFDVTVGDGRFLPEVSDPEYSNASSTALYELVPLMRHYHPVVAKFARYIANGVPSSGTGSLPPELGKCTPEELFNDYDPASVQFNPAIPVPKKRQPKTRPRRHQYTDESFRMYCTTLAKARVRPHQRTLHFLI